jgi:hypothetical protein
LRVGVGRKDIVEVRAAIVDDEVVREGRGTLGRERVGGEGADRVDCFDERGGDGRVLLCERFGEVEKGGEGAGLLGVVSELACCGGETQS